MLSDTQIKDALRWKGLSISGFDERFLQPASYDVHLHPTLRVLKSHGVALDPKRDTADQFDIVEMNDTGYTLSAGRFALASTLERLDLGRQLMAQVEGKSSLGRLGLLVHSTAGYIDPGFTGQVTLELSSIHGRGITLYPCMPIGQVAFMRVAGVARPYRGKYVAQHGPTVSRYHLNWSEEAGEWTA